MAAKINSKVIREKKWFLFSLFILSFFAFSIFQLTAWSQEIRVTVNGTEYKLAKEITLGQGLEKIGFELKSGDLLDVDGQVLEKGAGSPPVLTVNYQKASLGTKLVDKDEIIAKKGRDIKEEIIEERISLPFSMKKQGEGNQQKIVQPGKLGLKVITKGAVSGKLVNEQVIKQPVDKIVMLFNAAVPTTSSNLVTPDGIVYRTVQGGGAKTVALTFDDGPGPYTSQILNVLAQYNVKATFFMIGSMIDQHPEIARMVSQEGHAIGNHTMTHRNLVTLGPSDMAFQILEGAKTIRWATGVDPTTFRPPGGRYNPATLQFLNQHGYKLYMWSVDPRDWDNASAEQIQHHVLNHANSGSVILLHDGGGNRKETVKALPGIISGLQQKGYTFVTL